jgi:hypothetical protein
MAFRAKVLLALAVLSLASSPARAATSGPQPANGCARPAGLSVRAMRVTKPISVDGVLNEPEWSEAVPETTFYDSDPYEGSVPSQRTAVRVLYDENAIYIGAHMFDTHPDSVIARLTRRDVTIASDGLTVYLDPLHDHRSGYYFKINAAGTLYDGTIYNDGWQDDSWDAVWSGRARIDSLGWTAEMRIPLSQLRCQGGSHCVWGINFHRTIPRRNEDAYLVYTPKNGSGFVSRFPELQGIEDLHPKRSIEVLPYFTTKASYLYEVPGDPFRSGAEYKPATGGDLRMAVGRKLTLNATVNPDFGQVEVDPAVVNLSDVESYFSEKRPFFVEGSQIFNNFGQEGANDYWGFNFNQPTFFYSRRVGRAPQGSLAESTYVDVPVGTTILGAAKLIGKAGSSWNVGALSALTGREMATLAGIGPPVEQEAEPLTYYGVGRAQKDFKNRQAGLGFLMTSAVRSFDDPALRNNLAKQSWALGQDGWIFLDNKQKWVISGYAAASYVQGNSIFMDSLQQSSRHYFQRPDANEVRFHPGETTMSGTTMRYWVNKQTGNVLFNSAVGYMSPGFDVNDLGFHQRSDIINVHLGSGYKWTTPTKTVKYSNILTALFATYDFDGNPTSAGLWTRYTIEMLNANSFQFGLAANPQTRNTRRTRGGPISLNLAGYEVFTHFDSDSKKKLFYYFDTDTYITPGSKSHNWSVYPGVDWKPMSRLLVSFVPGFEYVRDNAQYVTTVNDPLAVNTYGKRYVMSTLDQKTLSGSFRVNWSFTPTVSMQLYMQPLVSSGDYYDYKELARPGSYDFNQYRTGIEYDPATGTIDPDGPGPAPAFNIGQPDFTYRSLRGNAVFRWEYRPGSTFYFVWTQVRQDSNSDSNFSVGPSISELVSDQADNIFLAKVTYYLGF